MTTKKNPHVGATLDTSSPKEGALERQGSKAQLAERMHTSRAQLDRILNAKSNVTVETLQRAAALVGRELRLQLM